MLDLLCDPLRLRRMMTRRDSLRAGFLGLGGLTLAELLRLRASAATNGIAENKDTAVILLFVHGGPSAASKLNLRVDGGELTAGVVDFHLPVDAALGRVHVG